MSLTNLRPLQGNGKKIFILGTNWVPMDALHCNDEARLPKALELLNDIGCNMVRCWGGNIYESDAFFDFSSRQPYLLAIFFFQFQNLVFVFHQ